MLTVASDKSNYDGKKITFPKSGSLKTVK